MKRFAVAAALLLLCLPGASAQQAKGKEKDKALEWGQFRGVNRDGLSPDTGLLKQWPAGGPPLLWKTTGLGAGYSSVSISTKLIFTMGDVSGGCNLIALNLEDGKQQWSVKIGNAGAPGGYGGPRCTPATDGVLVWALSQAGDLVCHQAATGRLVWKKSMEGDFGGRMMSGWGYSESPLLDGNLLVVTPGGDRGTVVALNKMTGALVWQSGELKDSAAYSSLLPIDTGKIRQYIVLTDKTLAGIMSTNGKLLWKIAREGKTAVCSTPVYKDGIIFVSSDYGVGCNGFKLSLAGNAFKIEQLYQGKMENHHGGMVLVGEHVYGLEKNSLMCLEAKTGKVVWQDRSVGSKGSTIYADGHLIVRGEGGKGPVALVEASPAAYKEVGRFDQPDRSDKASWANPVVYGGRLYLRDDNVLLCYNLKAN